MSNKNKFIFSVLLIFSVFFCYGNKRIFAGEVECYSDDQCGACEYCNASGKCTNLGCDACQGCTTHLGQHVCGTGCTGCDYCSLGKCVSDCSSCEECQGSTCVDKCTGCSICGTGGCEDDDALCNPYETCNNGKCNGCGCQGDPDFTGYCLEYLGGASCGFGVYQWDCADNGQYGCYFPNNAKLGDNCGGKSCYNEIIDPEGTTYCGHSSFCGGAEDCDPNNPNCAITPATDCAGGTCGGFCGYMRTQTIYCPDGGGNLVYCGDTCVSAPECAEEGSCGDPTDTPVPGATDTPIPTCPQAVTAIITPPVCNGNQVTLSWASVPNTLTYALRLDDHIDSWLGNCDPINPADLCAYTVNNNYTTTIIPGHTYGWWVHTVNNCGNWSAGAGSSFSCVPTNTPTPTCPAIAAPVINSTACSGSQVNVSWSSVPDTSYYALRFDQAYSSWQGTCSPYNPGDFCTNTNTTSQSYLITPGANYRWWIHAVNSCGGWSLSDEDFFNCPTITLTPTSIPPECSVIRSNISGCFGPTSPITPPIFQATYGSNQIQYASSLDNTFVDTWVCNSGWISSSSYTCPWSNFTTNPTSAPYYWSARSRSTSVPQTCSQSSLTVPTPIAFSVDKTAPNTPVTPVGSRTGNNVVFSWNTSTDTGCLDCSGYACKYNIQGYIQGPTPASGATPTIVAWDINNGEWTPASYTNPSYSKTNACQGYGGLYYVFDVLQAKDNYSVVGNLNSDNESAFNYSKVAVACPSPSAYPTINITGTMQQQSNTYCYQASAGEAFAGVTIAITPPANSCTTPAPVCSVISSSSSAWAYSCNITFNNQSCFAPTPSGTLRLFARASSSGSGAWGPTPVGTTCGATSSTVGYDLSSSTVISKDVIFSTTTNNWIKLKSSSYWTSNAKTNYLPPAIVNPYDMDDNSEKYFIIGGATPGPAGKDTGVGLGMTVCGSDNCYSDPHDWHDENKNYQAGYSFTPSQYLEYVKSMKDYKIITNFSASEIDRADKIYLIKGNQTVNIADFGRDKIVIIIANNAGTSLGTVTINGAGNTFNTANSHSIAIIADQIIFSNSLIEARGLFIANTINTGSNSSQGLKINGNLVAINTFTNNRGRADTSRPTIFIINNFKMYMDLLPYLSKSIYDWRQLQ